MTSVRKRGGFNQTECSSKAFLIVSQILNVGHRVINKTQSSLYFCLHYKCEKYSRLGPKLNVTNTRKTNEQIETLVWRKTFTGILYQFIQDMKQALFLLQRIVRSNSTTDSLVNHYK